MQHSSGLRYVDADEVGSEVVDFDGLKVRRPDGDTLGEVDGFIVDSEAQRAYYIVVDSGGWFRSRQFLVPIGHARMDEDGDALVLDVTRESIDRYPEFDRDSFERLNDDELRAYHRRFGEVCCGDLTAEYDHFAQPGWWSADYYTWNVAAPVGTTGNVAPAGTPAAFDTSDERDIRVEPERDVVGTRGVEGGDVSPHPGGRAQPGDVLGVESGGERTELGDTAQDEDERRREAERAAGKGMKNRD